MTPRRVPKSVVVAGIVALALLLGGRITACTPAQTIAAAGPTAAPTADPTTTPTAPPKQPATDTPPVATRPGGSTIGPVAGVKKSAGQNVALTFDDGPSPYTPQLLALLRAQGIKATFCLIGTEVQKYPHLVAQIAREGHTLCNHSWHHELKLGTKSVGTIEANLARTNAAIRRAVPGATIRYYRQPGGMWTPNVVSVAKSLGMTPLGWSVDPNDWRRPPAKTITDRVLRNTHRGSIVLMHDGGGDRSATITACRTIIPTLKKQFSLVPMR
ncbi:polysaccharide deacetylase family protein [Rhizomonospora bruguierae]|uniref:polysaccharide deacetylase family protein n=1 Tax=Rhizomonospora bruguierae TaxID=1581705 RepID=UPI001BCC26A5|nr:polysaccharide deacetylase family protein [Micromonospora sp. NBRC 107566]